MSSRQVTMISAAMSAMMSAIAFSQAEFPAPSELPARPELPDAFTLPSGAKVSTAEAWRTQWVPELKALFQHYEYGNFPPAPAKVEANLERVDKEAYGGEATLKELALSWGDSAQTIHLLLVIPNRRTKPAPVFLGLNFAGNHAASTDPKVRVTDAWMSKPADHRASEADRGKNAEAWCIEDNIARGYAVATFFNGDIVPDEPKLAEDALKKLRGNDQERGPADAGTIAAWAWCLHRAVDYLVTDKEIDPKRIALVGHSRNGKTALLAAAFDERVALVIPCQAGCGGTAPARTAPELAKPGPNGRSIAETVARINTSFPHWFCNNFKAFNDAVEKLPFDQHELIALCAPRPVLLSCATEDLWANPAGQFDMLKAANPVYQLVAGDGTTATAMPEVSQLSADRLGYFIRPGKHSVIKQDWEAWWQFADKWLK